MNQGIPKSALDALARQVPADEHPSADLLNAYAERALTLGEKDRVSTHLSACAECREILFLAGGILDEPAAKVVTRPQESPARWWSWKWAIPLAAGLALVFGGLAVHENLSKTTAPVAVQSASNKPARVQGSPGTSEGSSSSNASSVQLSPSPSSQSSGQTGSPADALAYSRRTLATPNSQLAQLSRPKPETQSAVPDIVGGTPAPPVAAQPNREVASDSPLLVAPEKVLQQDLAQQAAAKALAGSSFAGSNTSTAFIKAMPPRSRWRVTSEGHLEHGLSGDIWVQALPNEAVKFRAVGTVRNNVWAGGDGGVLFHSPDGGLHWSKVTLGTGDENEHAAITSVSFDSALQGSVTTESGASWTTSDGGQTWTKQ